MCKNPPMIASGLTDAIIGLKKLLSPAASDRATREFSVEFTTANCHSRGFSLGDDAEAAHESPDVAAFAFGFTSPGADACLDISRFEIIGIGKAAGE